MINNDIKTVLIQQCNHWFSEFKKIKKSSINKNDDLMIEALACAKGNLCILKELDSKEQETYDDLLNSINKELSYIYKKRKYESICNKKIENKTYNNLKIN